MDSTSTSTHCRGKAVHVAVVPSPTTESGIAEVQEADESDFESLLSLLASPEPAWPADWSGASLEVHTCHLKLPHAHASCELPPPAQLACALRDALPQGAALAGVGLRAGCLVLSLDVALPPGEGAEGFAARLAASLRGLFRGSGGVLRVGDTTVQLDSPSSSSSSSVTQPARPPPPLPSVSALCLRPASPLLLPLSAPLPEGCTPLARASGLSLHITAAGPLALQADGAGEALEAAGGRGALLFLECEPASRGRPQLAVSSSVPLLLCASEPLCAELNASGTGAEARASLCALGMGLAGDAPLRLRMRAASACMRQGWTAGLCEVMAQAAAGGSGDARALATWLSAMAKAPSCVARARATVTAALQRSGWAASLSGKGWGGKDAEEEGCGSALHHAGLLLQRSWVSESSRGEGGSRLVAALAALQAAKAEAAREGGWREKAAVPFIQAAVDLLSAEIAPETGDVAAEEAVAEAAAEAAQEEERFVVFMSLRNTNNRLITSVLTVLGNVMVFGNCLKLVLLRDAPPSVESLRGLSAGRLILAARLYPADGGPPFSPTEVAWPAVVTHVRQWLLFDTLCVFPANLVLLRFALRLRRGVVCLPERTLVLLECLDLLSFVAVQLQVWRATGGALLMYSLSEVTVLQVIFTQFLFWRGPYRKGTVRFYFVLRCLAMSIGALLLRPSILLTAAGLPISLHVLSMAFSAARAGARERLCRAEYEASKKSKAE